jgi:hypothetical protein
LFARGYVGIGLVKPDMPNYRFQQPHIDRDSYIVPKYLKIVIVHEVLDVVLGSGKKIIKTNDVVPFLKQSFA